MKLFLCLIITIIVSCGASERSNGKSTATVESEENEKVMELELNHSTTAREIIKNAPDVIWVMVRDENNLYYGSIFLYPDGRVTVSYEGGGVKMELLNLEWNDNMIILYYSLQYDEDYEESEGGGVWTAGTVKYYRVNVSSKIVFKALPVNSGTLDITVRPILVDKGDIPQS